HGDIGCLNVGQKLPAPVVLPGRDPALKILVGKGNGPVDQIAPRPGQLAVVALDKFPPGKVGIPGLRPVNNEEITQAVGLVILEKVGNPDGPVLACGQFPAFDGEKLAGNY